MFNKIIFVFIILSLCCSAIALVRSSLVTTNLANVILKSTYALEKNPQLTSNCFLVYMPLITELTNQYQDAYNGCLNISAEAEENLKKQLQGDIANIENISKDICSNFTECSKNANLYELFECYYNVANNTRQSAFDIQNISKDKMKFVQISEEYITYNRTTCTDKCSELYIEETAKVYDDLELCLAGLPPKNPVITTTTTMQPDKNTAEIDTTTLAIKTAPIETTTAPNDSILA